MNSSLWQSVSPVQYLSPLNRLKISSFTQHLFLGNSQIRKSNINILQTAISTVSKQITKIFTIYIISSPACFYHRPLYERKKKSLEVLFSSSFSGSSSSSFSTWGRRGYTSGLGSESRANEGTPWNFNLISL